MTEELLKQYLEAHTASCLTFQRKLRLQQEIDDQNENLKFEVSKKVRVILRKSLWSIDDVQVSTVINHFQALHKPKSYIEVVVRISKKNKAPDFLLTCISFRGTSNDLGRMLDELKCFVESL